MNTSSGISVGEFLKSGRSAFLRRAIAVCMMFSIDLFVVGGTALALPLLNLNDAELGSMVDLFVFLFGVYVIAATATGAFDPSAFRGRRSFLGRAVRALIIAFAFTFMALFLLKASYTFSRLLVALLAVLTVPGIGLGRLVIYPAVRRQLDDSPVEGLLIFDGLPIREMPGMVSLDARSAELSTNLDDFQNVTRIAALGSRVERIIVHCAEDRRKAWAHLLKCVAVRSEIYIPELDDLRPLSIALVGHGTSLVVSDHPLLWHQALLKRLFDIVVSSAILVLISPLLLTVAAAIRIESPGPALFRQKRVGFGNRIFVIFKFRSMRADQADHNASKLTQRNDARVTRVGAFIRRTSIDELPQLINVLLGHMSLVGPRPHAPGALAGDKLYWEVDEKYWHRHIAKPGITGLAQVRGFRGNTFEESDLQSRLDSDLEYVSNWSLLRDIEILLATLRVVSNDNAF